MEKWRYKRVARLGGTYKRETIVFKKNIFPLENTGHFEQELMLTNKHFVPFQAITFCFQQ